MFVRPRVNRGALSLLTGLALLTAVPAGASAASVVTLIDPPPDTGRVYYTGNGDRAAIHYSASLATDSCTSGLWYIEQRTLPSGGYATVAGSTTMAGNMLQADRSEVPGNYEVRARLDCVSPADDDAVSAVARISVVSGFPAPAQSPPTPSPMPGGGGTGSGPSPDSSKCVVPNVKKKALSRAKRSIRAASCRVGRVKKKKSRRRNRGRVLSQQPRARTVLPQGSKVTLVIGK